MLFPVTCINFHSFALGILDYGKQNNLNPSNGLYTLSTNSTLFQVSAIQHAITTNFNLFNKDLLPASNQLASDYGFLNKEPPL